MDSRQSLEFIERLIKEAQTNPAVRRVLKNATLKLAATQPIIQGIDDAHLENLFSMTVNRGGMTMFLKAMERVFADKSASKADKTKLVQCHPSHIRDMKKYFSSVVPFQVSNLSIETKHWDGSISTKKSDNTVGFYNDIDLLVAYLKKIGFSSPFKIEAKKKGLLLTFVELDQNTQILFDKAMDDIRQVNSAISEIDTRLEILIEVEEKIEDLERELNDKENELELLEKQRNQAKKEWDSLADYGDRPEMSYPFTPKERETDDARIKQLKEKREEYDDLGDKIKALKNEISKVSAPLNEAKMRYDELYNAEDKALARRWKKVSWDGTTQLTEEQLYAFIGLLKTSQYSSLIGGLPYVKTIKVAISCVVKSSSAGYDQATFKHLKNFIKLTVG